MYNAEAASKLINRANSAVAMSLNDITSVIGALSLQIRCHERKLEHHDDITAVITDILMAIVADTYTELANRIPKLVLKGQEDAIAFMTEATALNYHQRLKDLGTGYAKAFTASSMARALLVMLPELLSPRLDRLVKTLALLIFTCDDAIERKLLNNDRTQVHATIAEGLKEAVSITQSDVDALFGYACPELEALAETEYAEFCRQKLNGVNDEAALMAANSVVRADTAEIIRRLDQQRKEH